MKRKVMPSTFIAETYNRCQSKYIQHYSKIAKDPMIQQPMSSEKENWQYKNAQKDGYYYKSKPKFCVLNQTPFFKSKLFVKINFP